MAIKPKLRIFAGPNGAGKTTLYDAIKPIYFSTRLFVNADILESEFKRKNFLNLSDFDIDTNQDDFYGFCSLNGLFVKANFSKENWNLKLIKNVIVKTNENFNNYSSYHFAIIADFIRHKLILKQKSFSFETVFSHSSKLELIKFAHNNNYKVYLYFIGTETPVMNLERVKDRVKKGGHAVNDDKVEKRYFLTMDLLIDMIKVVDETYLWDNSGAKHNYIGNIKDGILNLEFKKIPNWIEAYILNKITP